MRRHWRAGNNPHACGDSRSRLSPERSDGVAIALWRGCPPARVLAISTYVHTFVHGSFRAQHALSFVEGARSARPTSRAIILHGELAPTDRDHRSYAHQVPRADEADQENRPQDDLSIVKKAYDYSLKNHEGQLPRLG
jgi:hypothetical protein